MKSLALWFGVLGLFMGATALAETPQKETFDAAQVVSYCEPGNDACKHMTVIYQVSIYQGEALQTPLMVRNLALLPRQSLGTYELTKREEVVTKRRQKVVWDKEGLVDIKPMDNTETVYTGVDVVLHRSQYPAPQDATLIEIEDQEIGDKVTKSALSLVTYYKTGLIQERATTPTTLVLKDEKGMVRFTVVVKPISEDATLRWVAMQ